MLLQKHGSQLIAPGYGPSRGKFGAVSRLAHSAYFIPNLGAVGFFQH
jgi:hypothetical protein